MKIPSVTGEIAPEALGCTLIHEHVTCADWSLRRAFGETVFDRRGVVDTAVRQYRDMRERFGLTTVVDGSPINLGRDIELLREISAMSGVRILFCTGFFFIEQPQLLMRSVSELAGLLLYEHENGAEGTGLRPAMLKCALTPAGVTPLMEKVLAATAQVSAETGMPIFCHTNAQLRQGTEAMEIFLKNGADPQRIVMGHSGDTNDIDYLSSLLDTGCFLGMDRFGICEETNSMENRVATMLALRQKGAVGRMLLSTDRPVFGGFGAACDENNAPDVTDHYADVFARAIPLLKEGGMSEFEIHQMLVENPRMLFETNCCTF